MDVFGVIAFILSQKKLFDVIRIDLWPKSDWRSFRTTRKSELDSNRCTHRRTSACTPCWSCRLLERGWCSRYGWRWWRQTRIPNKTRTTRRRGSSSTYSRSSWHMWSSCMSTAIRSRYCALLPVLRICRGKLPAVEPGNWHNYIIVKRVVTNISKIIQNLM